MIQQSTTPEVIPGILEDEFSDIEKKISLVEPYVSWVQIDVLDGTLFNNSCFHEPSAFRNLDTPLLMEAHLMVQNPVRYVEGLYAGGVNRFIAHIEGFPINGEQKENVYDFINICHQFNAEIGLAVDLPTDIESIFPYLESIDQVLVMTIHTGKSGQAFEKDALKKIEAVREKAPFTHIEVDGGINPETAKLAVAAGATRLAATSSIFKSDNIEQAIKDLKSASRV